MGTGFTLWFTGLSGSGKSTLAHAVAETIKERTKRKVDLLDGDVVRQHLSKGLSFSKEDRNTNIRRIGFVAHLITKHGGIAITAAISPYRAIREENRKLIGNFVEIFCDCPLEVCEQRDVKGLYKKARQAVAEGKGMQFTGIDDPYEEPLNPEISVRTDQHSIEEAAQLILKRLEDLDYFSESLTSNSGDADASQVEFIPDELLAKAEACFEEADRVHTQVLMDELHIGFNSAAQIINKLSESGKIGLR